MVVALSLLLALLAIPTIALHAAAESTFTAVLTRSGDGVAFARASDGAACSVDASYFWDRISDDGLTRIYTIRVRFADYDYVSASLFTDLEALGWFDEAYRSLEVFQDTTLRGSWQHSDDYRSEFTWETQRWEIGNGERWRFVVSVWGLDYGGETCRAVGDFRVYSVESTASLDYYGVTGYQGNTAIYMSTWISSLNQIILSTTTSQSDAHTPTDCNYQDPTVHNGVVLSVGRATNTTSQKLSLREFYDADGGNLQIWVPMTMAGASDVYHCTGAAHYAAIRFTLTFSVAGSPNSVVQVWTEYNSGHNVTGHEYEGTNLTQELGMLAWEAMAFLPGMGFIIGPYEAMRAAERLTGNVDRRLSLTGPGAVWQTFEWECTWGQPLCGRPHVDQITYSARMVLQIIIPRSHFMTSYPRFTITAQNGVDYTQGLALPPGATAAIEIPAYPAFMLTGTVWLGGATLKNHDVTISTTDSGPYSSVNYHLKTDSEGKYRFLAKPNTQYTLSSSVGGGTAQETLTTPNSPDGMIRDLVLPVPSAIEGYVTGSGGSPVNGAVITVTSPSWSTSTATTNSNGYYSLPVSELGTYRLSAAASSYTSYCKWQYVSNNQDTVYRVDFPLSTGTASMAPIYVRGDGGYVAGASVSVTNCYGTQVYSGRTDSNGMAPGVTGLTHGNFMVYAAWSEGGVECPEVSYAWRGSMALTVPPNQNVTVNTYPFQKLPCYF